MALYPTYGDVLSFFGLVDIYGQREKGAATSLFIGYCQVYLAYVFAPLFFSYGILYKKWFPLALAIAAFFLRIYDYSRTNGFVATRGSSGY